MTKNDKTSLKEIFTEFRVSDRLKWQFNYRKKNSSAAISVRNTVTIFPFILKKVACALN